MINHRKMIVSWDTYSWVHCLAGLIARRPKSFEVIVVTKDSETPIPGCRLLCEEAVYAQRAYDLWKIGTELGVRKLANMLYEDNNLDIEVLTAKLQMQVAITGVQVVYYQDNVVLRSIFKAIKKKVNIQLYTFDKLEEGFKRIISLSKTELARKNNLLPLMVGLPQHTPTYTEREYVYKIKE